MWFVSISGCGPVLNLKDSSTLSIGQTGLGVRFALMWLNQNGKFQNSYERNVHTSLLAVAYKEL